MPLNFRNGYKAWKLQIWENYGEKRDAYGNVIECVFPICNAGGSVEAHTPVMLTQETIGHTRINKLFGWQSQYIFNYDRFTAPEVLDKFKLAVDYWQGKDLLPNLQLMLFPRLDNLGHFLPVYPSDETIQIAIMRGGAFARGNKGVILKFNSINLITKLPVYDPNNLSFGLNNLSVK